nr:MAG TPA: hypothetical protein [Caudoviricetes sp.]
MAISILNYYEQPDGKNLMIMADDLYERNPGEAPDDNMPMDPTNYAISQNLGVPADGSITIARDFDEDKRVKTVTNVFKEGEWKDSTEGGSVKIGYVPVSFWGNFNYNPKQLISALQENDVVYIKDDDKSYVIGGFRTEDNSLIYVTALSVGVTVAFPSSDVGEEEKAQIIDLFKTKNFYPVVISYT